MQEICDEYYERMYICEGQKWDLEYEVRKKDWEVLQIQIQTQFFLAQNQNQANLKKKTIYTYIFTCLIRG